MESSSSTAAASRVVRAIVRQAIPCWEDEDVDDDVRDYLIRILTSSDSYDDVDGLRDLLVPYTNDSPERASALIHRLRAALNLATSDPVGSWNDGTVRPMSLGTPSGPDDNDTKENNDQHASHVKTKQAVEEQNTEQRNPPKEERRTKREQRLQRKRENRIPTQATSTDTATEDDASAWQERLAEGKSWGGRGHGGRGEYAGRVNHVKSNIHLSNVTISLPNGTELLQDATMDIVAKHRYALTGRNGVGKSTLLHRLAHRMIPGMPEMRILHVQQQVEGSDKTPLEVLLEADVDRTRLLDEQTRLEMALESGAIDESEIEAMAERLGDVMAELDAIGADTAEQRADQILRGLQFAPAMLHGPTESLSGGWRMRLALARALFVPSDLLLLDECTNHLDLQGLDWLVQYLTKDDDRTMIVVSHDRSFLDAVCTDVIRMEHRRLSYHVGNFSDYERQMAEKGAREAQILDAAERQRAKAKAFVQKQQAVASKKSADPNKQRQAKMIKEKKMDRIGNYREDGKRYKNFSLKQLDGKSVRLAQKVNIDVDEPVVRMTFPEPVWPPGIAPDDGTVRAEKFSFGYDGNQEILSDITIELRRGSKAALVGRNGSGKTTLVKLIAGDLQPQDFHSKGSLWRHPNIRVGHVNQYTVEELDQISDMTVVEYAEDKLRRGKASSGVVQKASGNVRQYLGAFGLGGRQALHPIGTLSGGERMRLCFATVLAEECHLLCLDESTNHMDIETLDVMSEALNAFEGSVLMVSHNQSFLSGFCRELWILEDGRLTVNHSDTASFDNIFAAYRSAATQSSNISGKRQTQTLLSKKAAKQSARVSQNTALL